MAAAAALRCFRPWPRTLRSRLLMILLAGLTVAQGLSFVLLFQERSVAAKEIMLGTLENDVATSIVILDRVPATERAGWLTLLNRRTYRYVLGPGLQGPPGLTGRGAEIAATIRQAAGPRFPVDVQSIPGGGQRLEAHLALSDGAPLTIDVAPSVMPLAQWLPYVMVGQLLLLVLCCRFAVQLSIRPPVNLADAANTLDPNKRTPRLRETRPTEVAYAAAAFNAMRDRIAHYLEERVQIPAAISHDLQTPITRMKLRAEIADESRERDKTRRSCSAMTVFVSAR